MWLPLMRPLLGTWPTTKACALTGNRTSNPLVHRLLLNPLSHTSQGQKVYQWQGTLSSLVGSGCKAFFTIIQSFPNCIWLPLFTPSAEALVCLTIIENSRSFLPQFYTFHFLFSSTVNSWVSPQFAASAGAFSFCPFLPQPGLRETPL